MRNKEKGITLIALIITIIVMLILVAVSISVALKTGLFKSASDATKNWKTAQDAEANVGSEIKIGDKTYGSLEEYIENTKTSTKDEGKRFSDTKEYTDGVKKAWIPAGFTVSGIEGETTIDGGLVIYDIPEGITPDWTKPDTVKTAYNQFVWIPVEVNKTTDTKTSIANFYRSAWSNNARMEGLDVSYTEPSATDDAATGIARQIAILTERVYKYGGFSIGRYEAGSESPRTSETTEKTVIGIKQDMYPYNFVEWGESTSDIGEVGAVALSNSLYNASKPNYGATSMLCTGACWDTMLDFIKDKDHDVTSSIGWGNYYDSDTYKIFRGSLCGFSDWSSADKTNGTDVMQGNLLTTGATVRNSAKNIYDVAGNCEEWTTEAYTTDLRVCRGRK